MCGNQNPNVPPKFLELHIKVYKGPISLCPYTIRVLNTLRTSNRIRIQSLNCSFAYCELICITYCRVTAVTTYWSDPTRKNEPDSILIVFEKLMVTIISINVWTFTAKRLVFFIWKLQSTITLFVTTPVNLIQNSVVWNGNVCVTWNASQK